MPERFRDSPGLSWPEGMTIMGGIDQFHVHGHIAQCYPRYSPSFIPGAGVQDGDVLETLWINTNKMSDSTRGMSSAHRQESIDDIMDDSNWNKLVRIGQFAQTLQHQSSSDSYIQQHRLWQGNGKKPVKKLGHPVMRWSTSQPLVIQRKCKDGRRWLRPPGNSVTRR